MSLRNWSKRELEHGRALVHSGVSGARSGQQQFLHGASLNRFLGDTLRTSCQPAVLGACIGALASCSLKSRTPTRRALAFGLLGGAIGFGASLAWKGRGLTASTVRGVARSIRTEHDQRWMRKHSIAYA
jgi:hypothetical protein